MPADPSTVEILVCKDDRAVAGVDAVLAYAGERAGLSAGEQRDLSRSVFEACDETFSLASRNGNPNPFLHLVISDFPNRVEVSIEESAGQRSGAPPNVRSVPPAQETDAIAAALQQMKIDRLRQDVHEGRTRVVLVKHHAANAQGHR